MIKKIILSIFITLILSLFCLVYIGNIDPPIVNQAPLTEKEIKSTSNFYNKADWGIHQITLKGSAFQRGQQFGFWTQEFIAQQEQSLFKKLNEIIPYTPLQYGLFLFSMGWFQGIENYLQDNWKQEMYGVSLYAPQKNYFFATPYTRQVAYHGIHDFGQMMVDHGLVLGACTQIAVPQKLGWIVGRNFDFEAGKVFDLDKIVKWVFPEKGNAFVSVVFAGMVGVITGVNNQGVYIAINAAGSDDFTRIGTPSTLIVLKALQDANTAAEAVEIIKNTKSLISDIFVILDRGTSLYVVEKTPERVVVETKIKKTVVTNHFNNNIFIKDNKNQERIENNTTLKRLNRAQQLISTLSEPTSPNEILKILRDKIIFNNKPVLNHRSSIDALIASHSVVYNSEDKTLFVSKGPSLSQEFVGIDLEKSFQQQEPVLTNNLPGDDHLTNVDIYSVKESLNEIDKARKLAHKGLCQKSRILLENTDTQSFNNHYRFYWAQAELALCEKDHKLAKILLQKTLDLEPAYKREKEYINEKISIL